MDPVIDIRPGVGILGVFGHLNYEPWYALAEYVDNSIQSATKNYVQLVGQEPGYRLKVDIHYEREDGGRIVIVDNAGGIARQDFPRAFRAAELPPDRSGLSEFGMGMKSASIWFAKKWRVVTTSVGDPHVYTIEFDMAKVVSDNVEQLDVSTSPIGTSEHFTRIELWDLNQTMHGRTLGKVRDHLREIYRGFLRDGRLDLAVAGQNMAYTEPEVLEAPDYRAESDDSVDSTPVVWRKRIGFELDGDVRVDGWAAIRAEGRTSGNGFSLFRRGRVIVGTSDAPYRPASIFGGSNSYRSQRLFGELNVVGLPVSHTKDGFQWHGLEEAFEERLRAVLDDEPKPLLKQAEGYRARKASKAEQQRIQQAADNTAEVAERSIPGALEDVVQAGSADGSYDSPPAHRDPGTGVFSRDFTFSHAGTTWSITISAIASPSEPRWLVSHVNSNVTGQYIEVALTLNASHPFLSQFALGSTDALEAVFRLAVAMTVSQSLMVAEGDGEYAARYLRQVDALLSGALSKRLRSDA